MTFPRLLTSVLLVALLLAAPSEAAKKKPKPVRCKAGQVTVKLGSVKRCEAARKAFPRPRAGDRRLIQLQTALGAGAGGLRDRRRRQVPSVQKMLAKVGPSVYGSLLKVIPQVLVRLDRPGARASRRGGGGEEAKAAAACFDGPAPPSESFTSGGFVTTVDFAGNSADIVAEVNGYRVRVSMSMGCGEQFKLATCPTAAGAVDGTDQTGSRISLVVSKDGVVTDSTSVTVKQATKLRGQTADDAKLDTLVIDDVVTVNIAAGGTKLAYGPVTINGSLKRHADVNMRTGSYVIRRGDTVDVAVSAGGTQAGDVGAIAGRLRDDYDKNFAATVDKAISRSRAGETEWNKPGTCVSLTFNPASRTLKLRRGQRGSLSAQALAVQGGGAVQGRWTRTGQRNASFTPERAEGAEPRFSYDVTNAGRGIVVAASFRVTSKAGVGEGTWEQEAGDPLYRGTVSGTRAFQSAEGCNLTWQFSYNARLADMGSDQPFAILEADPSGLEFGGARGYDESGSGTYSLAPCNGRPGCSTTLVRDPGAGSGVTLFSVDGDNVRAEVDGVGFTTGDCEPLGRQLSIGTFPRSKIGDPTITVDLSYRDDVFTISGTLTLTRVG